MKNKLLGIYLLAFMMMAVSCLKDKGNYNYKEINEVHITGIEQKVFYEVFSFIDVLKINPEIEGQDLNNPNRYDFEWKLMNRFGNNTADSLDLVVGKERNLNLPVTLTAGEYKGYFKVTDKVEGTSWGASFHVLVKSLTNEGYMVLCDDNGEGRLDMISSIAENEYKVAHNIWKEENYNWGKPVGLFFNYNRGGSSTLYLTESGTFKLDSDLLTSDRYNLKWSFGINPENVKLLGTNSTTFSYEKPREVLVTADQKLFARSTTMAGSLFEFPINFINGTDEFRASSHIGIPYPNNTSMYWPYGHTIVIYDETNKQFLELTDMNEYPTPIKFTNTSLFSPKTGKDMLHMESTLNKYTMAVLKDPVTQRYFMYGMILGYDAINSQEYYLEVPIASGTPVKHFAFHPVLPYLFYATDQKVYQFDYSQPALAPKEVLNYPDAIIKTLKFFPMVGWNPYQTWERNKALILFVGRNENGLTENQGVVELYTAPPLGAPLIQKNVLTGFGEIVDIERRER